MSNWQSRVDLGGEIYCERLNNLKGEYIAEIEWQVDFPKFCINAGDTEKLLLRFGEIDALSHAHGRNGVDELVEELLNKKYPGIGQLDFGDDYIITNEEEMYDYHDMFIGKERVYETIDDSDDWSASEGEVEIMWDTDEYEDFGIFKGEGSTYLIDYDRVDTHDDLINEVCRMIGKEYPDLDFGTDDFVVVNEDEFWE